MSLEIHHGDPVLDGLGVNTGRLEALFGADYVLVVPPFYNDLPEVRRRVCRAVDVALGEAKDDSDLIRFRDQVELRLRIKAALFYLPGSEKAQLVDLAKRVDKGFKLQLTDFHGYPIGEILGKLLRFFPGQVDEIKALFAADLKVHTGITFVFRKTAPKKAQSEKVKTASVKEPVVVDAPPVEEAPLVEEVLPAAEEPQDLPRVLQDELIKQHMAWVKGLAKEKTKSRPHDFEDVYAAGVLGLVKAARRFKARVGEDFRDFARRFIERAMRREFSFPEELLGEIPFEDEAYVDPPFMELAQIRLKLKKRIKDLPARLREPLLGRFLYGKTDSQLAVRLGSNEGAIAVARKGALAKIRASFPEGFFDDLGDRDFAILDMLLLES